MSETIPTGVWIGMAVGGVALIGLLLWVTRFEIACCFRGREKIGDAEAGARA